MPVWRDIAVFLDATPVGEHIGRHAAMLAQRHKAHLVGVYGVSHESLHPAETHARGSRAMGEVMARQRHVDEEKVLAAARHFGDLVREHQIGSEFRIVWRNALGDDGILRALHCDLIVAAHPKPADLPAGWSAERLLLTTGIPVLLVPNGWHGETIGENVLIAWNRSREARRAVNDAMPFINAAGRVTILTVDSDRHPDHFGPEPGSNLLEHLSRHGAHVDIANISSGGAPVAEVILGEAATRNADLVVIGAYSHPRTAEILFGGVTRSLLSGAHLPLLISR
ncbi:universal stress protein [Sphingobium sp. CFD-2]|jgi:nucleotide-binding universal stress UspA family protein|uniref:universal stress protein n=2 Tax=Sphingobium TaxID=165695 RepID=UPI00214C50E1|nr:universal stress protein [Sphingobium sp. CFD-2]MCZ4344092.1 universal stress protein [Sphingomonadaceae bacterium G21617-S1]